MGTTVVASATVAATAGGEAHETVIVTASGSCVRELADGVRALSFDCLNAQIERDAAVQPPLLRAENASGRGNPEAVGTFSYTATQIRMGSNFGKSAVPQRPASQSFTGSIHPGGK